VVLGENKNHTGTLVPTKTLRSAAMEAKNMTMEALKWGRGEMRCEVDCVLQKLTQKAIRGNQIKKAKWLIKLRNKIADLK
jgi:hypothetical protein